MSVVINEISNSMLRFTAHLKIQDLIAGLTEILIDFLTDYEKDSAETAITEQSDEEVLLELEAGQL